MAWRRSGPEEGRARDGVREAGDDYPVTATPASAIASSAAPAAGGRVAALQVRAGQQSVGVAVQRRGHR